MKDGNCTNKKGLFCSGHVIVLKITFSSCILSVQMMFLVQRVRAMIDFVEAEGAVARKGESAAPW